MTIRQRILKAVYPLIIGSKLANKYNRICFNTKHIKPNSSVYNITFELNDGTAANLASYKGRNILVVNTASDCGYTPQYEALEKLYQQYNLMIIAFPSNDFKKQEKGSDKEIAQFCKANYGISFPIAKKCIVIKREGQHKLFEWLSDATKNGWLNKVPVWNFCKYLINEDGVLTHYFEPGVEPLSSDMIKAIQL